MSQHTPGINEMSVHLVSGSSGSFAGPEAANGELNLNVTYKGTLHHMQVLNLIAAAPELLEALEQITEALDTVLLHQGKHMTPSDQSSRAKLVLEARAAIAKAEGRA